MPLTLSHTLPWNTSSKKVPQFFAGLLPLGRSALTNRGNLYTRCWCFFINILCKKGDYCIKILLYLCGCALIAATAVDNLSYLMLFNRHCTFNHGSRPWYPYSIRFPRIIWYLTCQTTYISQFHNFLFPSYLDIWSINFPSDAVVLT